MTDFEARTDFHPNCICYGIIPPIYIHTCDSTRDDSTGMEIKACLEIEVCAKCIQYVFNMYSNVFNMYSICIQ